METPYRSSRIADLSAEDRPREKALAIGVEALTTTELVALLLGSGTPGESVINLSQRILADSGNSLQELSRRTIRNLVRSFKGVGDAKAVTLLAAIELGKRYAQEGPVEKPVINMPSKAYDLMLDKLTGLDHEEFWVIYLNTAKRVITRARISQGGVAATVVDVKIVLRHAIDNLASAIILVHNHPSGSLRPSAHDDALTDKLKNAAKLIDVCVVDHIIFSSRGFYSYSDGFSRGVSANRSEACSPTRCEPPSAAPPPCRFPCLPHSSPSLRQRPACAGRGCFVPDRASGRRRAA